MQTLCLSYLSLPGANLQYFRQNLLSVRRLRKAPTVDEAIAQIGYGRTNYGDVPLGRCSVLKPDSADIINWCKNFYSKVAKELSPTRAAIESAWEKENPGQVKRMRSLFSIGVLSRSKYVCSRTHTSHPRQTSGYKVIVIQIQLQLTINVPYVDAISKNQNHVLATAW